MSSRFDLFDEPKVLATVSTPNGASELYLIDRSFNEVARGVGRIELPVAPGQYQVRERIGDVESVSDVFDVGGQKHVELMLRGVAYDSPLPIAGSATFQVMPEPLRRPRPTNSTLRIVVRDPQPGTDVLPRKDDDCMMEEVGRLRIETLTGQYVARLSEVGGALCAPDLFAVDLDLDPGSYALVQEGSSGRQSCMALYVMADWQPAVYFLLPRQASPATTRRRIRLAEASLFYAAMGADSATRDIELARLEAARHALSRGRPIGGWAVLPDEQGRPIFNPLMALIDAHLLLHSGSTDGVQQAEALIADAATAFGESFPDIQAVRMAQRKAAHAAESSVTAPDLRKKEANGVNMDSLTGPPILARSWRHLLEACNVSDRPAVALPFEFSVEPSESWFIWSENIEARTRAGTSAVQKGLKRVMGTQLLDLVKQVFVKIAYSDKGAEWVDSVHQIAAKQIEREDSVFADPAMQRIVAALVTVTDPIVRETFRNSPGDLIQRAWASLQVPNEMLKSSLRKFARFLEQNGLLAGLIYVVGMALVCKLLVSLRPAGEGEKPE